MEFRIEHIGGNEAIVKFEGQIHIDCPDDKTQLEFEQELNNLIDKYAI